MSENSSLPPPAAESVPASTPAATVPPAQAATALPWRNPWPIIAVVALGLSGWQWIETRLRLADTQQEMAKRLADSDAANKENRIVAKQAQDQVAALQAKLGLLEGKLAESQSQQASLENLYQDLARSRDEWALSEIEQSVTLAAQQLQLAGNVQGAVLALQAADSRLAGSSRPQFIGVRKALTRDLDRLKSLPQIDLPGMSVRLESVVTAIDTLPLAVDVRPREESAKPAEATGEPTSAWREMFKDAWREIRSLVRIQRFDRDEPVLLAPGQDFFLRENLKLRLLNARLALLSRDQVTFRGELKAALDMLGRLFDGRDKGVQAAQATLRQLLATEIVIALPTLNETQAALRVLRNGKDKK